MARPSFQSVHWPNTLFLGGTLLAALVGAPLYVGRFGLDPFQVILFLFFFIATGMSITLGYHRLFAHLSFQASWPIRAFTLLFGAGAFENSALSWAADHRKHHKHVDHDEDPYDINKGFFHAHIGWILFRYQPAALLDGVQDLKRDRLVMWQHNHYKTIAIGIGFALPALLGFLYNGWIGALGSFLIAGMARVVLVHHMTFFINSLCHTLGSQPYSSRCTARDSWFMALFTFGEGYHNFHHEFQHDYRNGVKPWQFDPTKWCIWTLHRLGLVKKLRRVPEEKRLRAEIAEQQRRLEIQLSAHPEPLSESIRSMLKTAHQRLHTAAEHWETCKTYYRQAAERGVEASRERMVELRRELHQAGERLRDALNEWKEARRLAMAQMAC